MSATRLTRFAVLMSGAVAAGCSRSSGPASTVAAPASPTAGNPAPTGDHKGWTKTGSWKAGEPLPPGATVSRPEPPPGSPPEVSGTAEVICQELVGKIDTNKYFAKVLQVEGVTVPPPAKLFPNAKIKFALAGVPKAFGTEGCNVVGVPAPGEEEKVKALVPGRKVRVVGYAISAGMHDVGMTNCRVTDLGPGPEPTPIRPAEEVTAEFVKDAAAARKKYGLPDEAPAVLLIRGKVSESAAAGEAGTYRLTGADGATVLVAMKVDQYTKVPEVGKTATACGVFDGYDAASKTLKLRTGSVIPY